MREARWLTPERVGMYALLLAVPWMTFTVLMARTGGSDGIPDFAALWAAGQMVVEGQVADVYNPSAHNGFIVPTFPDSAEGLPFLYLPPGLLVVAPLGLFSFGVAFALWTFVGLALYLRGVWAVVPRVPMLLAAVAFVPSIWTLYAGQTGFFLAAATAGFFVWLERRPVACGLCLAAFIVKPHLAILLPVVLVVRRQWRSLWAAAAGVGASVTLSGLLFGWHLWDDFRTASDEAVTHLDQGLLGRFEVQSLFPVLRGMELPTGPATIVQGAATIGLACLVAWLWVRQVGRRPELIAFTIAAGLMASPRVFTYDAQILAIAAAYLVAAAHHTGFLPYEKIGLVIAGLLPLGSLAGLPATFIALVLVLALTARRVRPSERTTDHSSPGDIAALA